MNRITLIAALALAGFTTPAWANTQAQEVQIADLDLTTAQGQQALDNRLNSAARASCGTPGSRSLQALSAHRRCREAALAAVRPQAERAIAAAMANQQVQLAAGPMAVKRN